MEISRLISEKGADCQQLLQYTLSWDMIKANQFNLWFSVITLEEVPATEAFIIRHVEAHPELPEMKDKQGRSAYDMATATHKAIFQDLTLWFGRYRITETRPEHTSATCYVFKAIDEKDRDSNGKLRRVALKLMLKKAQFKRELAARDVEFSPDHVVAIIRTHPLLEKVEVHPDEISMSGGIEQGMTVTLTKGQAERLFCIVMPLADRNLFVAMKQERFAGRNMEEVRHIFQQICQCVQEMHRKGVAHADIKPLNIVRMGTEWKLIDLDAAARLGEEAVGFKSSTAYMPPEALDGDLLQVRSYEGEGRLVADASFDIWSLGCILYQLTNKDVLPLFQANGDDNLSSREDLMALVQWSNTTKSGKLDKVEDLTARNLVGRMLTKDATKRPTLEQVLVHPFLSKKSVVRMVGEKPEFDVFISYRVWSDLEYVQKLYHMLCERGLKVWWDKECLKSGEPWEVGFCQGLMNSNSFVCIVTKSGINDEDSGDRRNFWALKEESSCDNVLLEHRLAVELNAMGVINKVGFDRT